MTSPPEIVRLSGADTGDDSGQAQIYVLVILVEILTLLLLWALDRYFGG